MMLAKTYYFLTKNNPAKPLIIYQQEPTHIVTYNLRLKAQLYQLVMKEKVKVISSSSFLTKNTVCAPILNLEPAGARYIAD